MMFWQCNECGGLLDAVPRSSVCPECGTASSQIMRAADPDSDLSELRDLWVHIGMAQDAPLLDFSGTHG
jgi:rubredoxin